MRSTRSSRMERPMLKHEVEIRTSLERWGDSLSTYVFHGFRNRFASGTIRGLSAPHGRWWHKGDRTQYTVPSDVNVEWVGRGEFAAYSIPKYKYAAHLEGDGIVRGWKGCFSREDKGTPRGRPENLVVVMVLTYEYVLSNESFENACDMAISRFSDRKDFCAVIAIRQVNPFLDYIEGGLVMTYGDDKKDE